MTPLLVQPDVDLRELSICISNSLKKLSKHRVYITLCPPHPCSPPPHALPTSKKNQRERERETVERERERDRERQRESGRHL